MSERFGFLLLMLLLRAYAVPAQDAKPLTALDRRPIQLDVVVTEKSGAPVSGLQLEDFTLLDNDVPQTITSFEAVEGRQTDVEVVLVIDAVNVEGRELAIAGEEVKKFLKADQGRFGYATTFAVLTETGIQFHLGFSKDGKAISSALDHFKIPRRSMTAARFDSSFKGFAQLLAEERERPGRKLIVWVSPGWPVVQHTLDAKQRQNIFENVVEISNQLREGQITLYSVDPSGTADTEPGLTDPPTIHLRPSGQPAYRGGPNNSSEVELGHLALPVIAVQSGGLALHSGNEMVSALRRCVAGAGTYYKISFNPPRATINLTNTIIWQSTYQNSD